MELDLSGIDPSAHALARRCSVGDIPSRGAQSFGPRTALTDDDGSWTYAELESISNRFARGLLALGAAETEPVAIFSTNSREFVASYFAAAKAGMVALPINLLAGAENILHALTDSQTRILVVHSSLLPLIAQGLAFAPAITQVVVTHVPEGRTLEPIEGSAAELSRFEDVLSTDDGVLDTLITDRQIVQCLYSSGTTSRPKGVLTSHLAVSFAGLTNAVLFGGSWGAKGASTVLALPLFHTAGLNGVLVSYLSVGGTIRLLPGFDPTTFVEAIAEVEAKMVLALPMMLEAVVTEAEYSGTPLSSLEHVVYAMAPMSEATYARLSAAMPQAEIVLGSGMSECTPATVLQWPEDYPDKAAAWGHPSPSTFHAITTPGGPDVLGPNTDGELSYRGPTVMEGYWNNPEANAEVFAGGFMHSGDLGRLDPEGVVWFADRVKDVIKSGGENVSSLQVERTLAEHPHVAEVAVIGRADATWGEQVVAIVVPGTDAPGDEALIESLLDFGAGRLSSAQRPREVHIVAELPKTATGKIRKVELRGAGGARDADSPE